MPAMTSVTQGVGPPRSDACKGGETFVKNSIHPDVLRYPHPIVKADKLKKRTIHEFAILGKNYVLFRDAEGKAAATLENCPHRGALLAKGA